MYYILDPWIMVAGGKMFGAPMSTVQLFNTQSGQSCYKAGLPDAIVYAAGGIFDGFPALCGGKTYWLQHLDTCYKYNQTWIPVRDYTTIDVVSFSIEMQSLHILDH